MPTIPPLYQQIIADIQAQIASGQLKPGQRLPTIEQFREQHQCSAAPVKLALRVLSATGVVVTHQGRGSYVAPGHE
jgi:GntR family transcriptional regulator